MRYRYLDDFRRGISVFAIFSYGIAVLGTPQCPPLYTKKERRKARPLKVTYDKKLAIFNLKNNYSSVK